MNELYRRVAAPAAALTIAIGGGAVAEASDGGVQLGPATRESCKAHKVSNGVVMQCKRFVNDVLRELESQTTRDYARYTPQGDLIQDHYTLYRDTQYDPFGRRIFHSAACRITRHVNRQQVPVTCILPGSEPKEKIPPPEY
jgi:hypothetical protein